VKLLIASLLFVCLTLASIPAAAGNVYDNGPVNGTVEAWTINFGLTVTDSFTVANGNGNIGGMNFWAWLVPGDTITSVEVQIGVQQFGNELMDMQVGVTQSNCFANNFGYNVCLESTAFNGPSLGNGNYWVTLGNATVPSGDPTYWDENSGIGCQSQGCPSQATCNNCIFKAPIPSEAFTLTAQGTTTSTGTTPEPNSIWLFGAGFLGVFARIRGKLF
jgi:hypothetical protein